jgi:exopolysaccharide production protein ExoQ
MYQNIHDSKSNRSAIPSTSGLALMVGVFFGFRIFIMLLSVRLLGLEAQTGVGITLTLTFLCAGFVAFASLGQASYPVRRMAQLASVRWALAFLAVSGCSLMWSSAVSLPAAIAYWLAMAADVAIVILLLRTGSVKNVTQSFMKGYVWGACVVAMIAWLLPAQSDLRLGDEELLGPNQIGYLCAFAFFFVQYLIRENAGKWGAAGILLVVTLLRSLSKTTIIAFVVSEAFLLLRDRSISRRNKVIATLAVGAMIVAFWSLLSSYYDVYTNAGSQSETLTGRVGIWAYILAEALQQPWIGHGFHSVWKVIPPFGFEQFEARHAHNELLQQFYAYGLVGVCLFAGIYTSMFRHIRRHAAGPLRALMFSFLIFVLVRGLADTEVFDLSLPLWSIVLLSLLVERSQSLGGDARVPAVGRQLVPPSKRQPSLASW